MTNFTPTPEAVEAVASPLRQLLADENIYPPDEEPGREDFMQGLAITARAAIAAFVEAEGLIIETHSTEPLLKRPVGPWRKRD